MGHNHQVTGSSPVRITTITNPRKRTLRGFFHLILELRCLFRFQRMIEFCIGGLVIGIHVEDAHDA